MAEIILERYRGDTFPIEATLSRNGTWTLVGAVKMTFKFDDDVLHTFDGTIVSSTDHIVTFIPTAEAIETVRSGIFDIQVNDGSYIYTHLKGTVDIIGDVTI